MVIDILDIIVAYESYDVSPKSWDQVFTLKNETLQQSIGPANMRTSVDFKGSPLCGSKKSLKTTILNKGFNKEKTPNILVEFESLWLVWLTLSPPQDPHKFKTLGRGIYPNYPRGLFSGLSFINPCLLCDRVGCLVLCICLGRGQPATEKTSQMGADKIASSPKKSS